MPATLEATRARAAHGLNIVPHMYHDTTRDALSAIISVVRQPQGLSSDMLTLLRR